LGAILNFREKKSIEVKIKSPEKIFYFNIKMWLPNENPGLAAILDLPTILNVRSLKHFFIFFPAQYL
jgi:hypothetical protein